jgi:hypothetical protein
VEPSPPRARAPDDAIERLDRVCDVAPHDVAPHLLVDDDALRFRHDARMKQLAIFVALAISSCGAATTTAPTRTSSTTTVQADSVSANQGALGRLARTWPDGATVTYAIRWTSPGTAWLYDGTLALTRSGVRVRGTFSWRLLAADASMPELAMRVGSTAMEQIEGTFDPSRDLLVLQTISVSDDTLIGAATYQLTLTGDELHGLTAGVEDGIEDGRLDGTR